jgi:hypothetical protein
MTFTGGFVMRQNNSRARGPLIFDGRLPGSIVDIFPDAVEVGSNVVKWNRDATGVQAREAVRFEALRSTLVSRSNSVP